MKIGALVGEGWWRRVLRTQFRRLLRMRGHGGLRRTLPGGEVVRVGPAYRFATWNPVEYDAFRSVLRSGDVALDIGANVGAYTMLFGLWVGERGRVVAVEPAPGASAGLEEHLVLNGLDRRVEIVRAAASDRLGTAQFTDDGAQGTNHLLTHPPSGAGRAVIEVPTTSVDALCSERGLVPRLIKIDVEGAELLVLRGARRTIAAMPADGAVFVEMHPGAWPALGQSLDAMLTELAAQRLTPVPLRSGVSPWELDGECVRLDRG